MKMTALRIAALLIACGWLGGCESLLPLKPAPTPVVTPPVTSVLDGYVAMLAILSGQDKVKQSDVFYEVEKNQTLTPTTLNLLSYALALTIPGHPNSDLMKGKRLLEQVLSNPERISSTEQSLAMIMLNSADQGLKAQAEMRRLSATVDDRTRTQSNSERRFQAQADEINRLRKALDAAQQKLDAIRDIEKSISERSTSPTGTRDTGSRDSPAQTQTPPVSR
jgi:hypothetical protein